MAFGRETMLNDSTFPATSTAEEVFDTYTKISQELYGAGEVYKSQRCPFLTEASILLEVLDDTTCQDLIVQDCWLLFLPICLQHEECAFCAPNSNHDGTKSLATLRKKVIRAASHEILTIHNTVSSSNGFLSPLIASTRALSAGSAILAGLTKGWAGSRKYTGELLKCSEILSICAPHWKGGRGYLDVWRAFSSSLPD